MAMVLMTSPVLAWNWNNPNLDATQVPNRYVRLDVAQVGWDGVGTRARLLKFDYIGGRFRAGVSLVDVWESPYDADDLFLEIAPMHVGFTIAALPVKTSFFWSRGLDAYLQAEAAVLGGGGLGLTGLNVEACVDADYYGVGVGLYAGWGAYYGSSRFWTQGWANTAYVGLRLRLLTLGVGFR
ncbi:MAG: hypothetical protein NTX53_20640 [candidate division WOR-3 bacterium]|nr:hypothetical protein [candidate division WOR-3 bacterium]